MNIGIPDGTSPWGDALNALLNDLQQKSDLEADVNTLVTSGTPSDSIDNKISTQTAAAITAALADVPDDSFAISATTGLQTALDEITAQTSDVLHAGDDITSLVGTLDLDNMPAGFKGYVLYASGVWPARPSARTDISFEWIGLLSDPPDVGGSGMLDGVDTSSLSA